MKIYFCCILAFTFIALIVLGFKGNYNDDFVTRLTHSPIKWAYLPFFWAYYQRYFDKNYFQPNGILLFCGEQGSGKTISMTKWRWDTLRRYKKAKCLDNYILCNLQSWRDILKVDNGKYGVIIAIDELGLWLNSKNSKDFDISLLQIVAQNRKQRRVILGSCQQFYQVAKDVRCQTKLCCSCRTFLGFITFNFWSKPVHDAEGNLIKQIPVKVKCFIQSPNLRNSYDTYKTIIALSKDGFIRKDLINDTNSN